jgi:hypothetical protein
MAIGNCQLGSTTMQMRLTVYFGAILLFVLGMYTLQLCARGFRQTRGTGTSKPRLYLLGIVLSAGLIVLAVAGVFSALFGRLHW